MNTKKGNKSGTQATDEGARCLIQKKPGQSLRGSFQASV